MTTNHKNTAVNRSLAIGLLAGALRAGQNHYQQTGDLKTATQIGANAGMKLFAWIMVCFMWWCALGWIAIWWFAVLSGNYGLSAKLPILLLAAPWLCVISPLLGVLWCRNGDYCLFNRGPVYKLWASTARRFENWSDAKVYAVLLGGILTSDILLTIIP